MKEQLRYSAAQRERMKAVGVVGRVGSGRVGFGDQEGDPWEQGQLSSH